VTEADLEEQRAARHVTDELARLRAEVERLRAALMDVRDLAKGDAPNHMILDVCEDAMEPRL
jgi:hypothetical protein